MACFLGLVATPNDRRLNVGPHVSCVRSGEMPSKCTCLVKRTHEPFGPTLAQTVLCVDHVDNQRLAPCISISAILRANFSHISVQYRQDYAVKWVRLKCWNVTLRIKGGYNIKASFCSRNSSYLTLSNIYK